LPTPKPRPPSATEISKEEWDTRVNLAAAYRLVALYAGTISSSPTSPRACPARHHFLINPYGLDVRGDHRLVAGEDRLQARKVMPSPYDINPAGFTTPQRDPRGPRRCDSASCTRNSLTASPFRRRRTAVLPISQQSLFVAVVARYQRLRSVALNETKSRGLVATSATKLPDAAKPRHPHRRAHDRRRVPVHVPVRSSCMIQVRAAQSGRRRPDPHQTSRSSTASRWPRKTVTRGLGGALVARELLRKLESHDSSFRIRAWTGRPSNLKLLFGIGFRNEAEL